MKETSKQLRHKLYERQRRILNLREFHESVCLPGWLIRLNPTLLK